MFSPPLHHHVNSICCAASLIRSLQLRWIRPIQCNWMQVCCRVDVNFQAFPGAVCDRASRMSQHTKLVPILLINNLPQSTEEPVLCKCQAQSSLMYLLDLLNVNSANKLKKPPKHSRYTLHVGQHYTSSLSIYQIFN